MRCCSPPRPLFDALKRVSGVLLDECLGKGMMPNLKSNKTEVLLHCSGKGAKAARRDLLSDKEPTVTTASRYWPEARIKVVPRYRHLGGILHHRAGLGAEARSRAAQAWHAFQKHKKTIFVHANVYLEDKTVLFGTLVLSTLFHACGTWGQIDADAFSVLNRAYVNMARAILSKHFRGDLLHLCEDRVLALLRLPSLSTWIHFHRLSYLASFVVISEPLVWALAHAERHWLAAVRDSLAWLWGHVDGGRKFSSWEAAWPEWCDDIRRRPRAWKSLIRFGRDSALRAEVLAEGWQQCRAQSSNGPFVRVVLCQPGLTALGGFVCDPQPGRGSKHALLQSEFLGATKQGCGPFPEPLTVPGSSAVEDLTGHSIWTALGVLLQPRLCELGEQQCSKVTAWPFALPVRVLTGSKGLPTFGLGASKALT